MTTPRPVELLDLVLCWTAGLVGYLVAEYGAGALLMAAVGDGGPQSLPSWTWLPWIAGPAACGVLAAAVVPLAGRPSRGIWAVAGGAVPLLAAPVTWFVVADVATAGLVVGVVVQVLVAAAAATVVGWVRQAVEPALASRRRAPAPPVTYTS